MVCFRNSSFGTEKADKGPPRLNLYRTSQIIAQLPREPPPDLDEDEAEEGGGGGEGTMPSTFRHIPPPPGHYCTIYLYFVYKYDIPRSNEVYFSF